MLEGVAEHQLAPVSLHDPLADGEAQAGPAEHLGVVGGIADGHDAFARDAVPGKDFAGLVKDAIGSTLQANSSAETTAAQALTGQANMNDVVLAVANAEVALQTVVAVRDRVVQAYQEILRMPM